MVSHLPTVEMRYPGRAGKPGTTARVCLGGVPGKITVTISAPVSSVKSKLGKMHKMKGASARKAGPGRHGHHGLRRWGLDDRSGRTDRLTTAGALGPGLRRTARRTGPGSGAAP